MARALALALLALAASGATAQSPPTLRIVTETPLGGANAGQGGQIEAESFSWGPRQSTGVNKVDSFTVKQKVKPVASGGGANQVSMDDTAGKEAGSGLDAGMKRLEAQDKLGNQAAGANETLTVGSARTESGQATGKRQHMPLRAQGYYDRPPDSGSLRVKVKMPWLACEEGKKIASLELSDGPRHYLLQDISVASCGGTSGASEESITFVYGKVKVRAWDPAKKEN